MRQTKFTPAWTLLGVVLFGWPGASEVRAGSERFLGVETTRIRHVLDLGYALDPQFEEAFAALQQESVGTPLADVIGVGRLYWLQVYARWDEGATARYEREAEAAEERAQAYVRAHPEDRDAQLALALVQLTQVMHAVDGQHWWSVWWKSRAPLRTMARLLAADPDCADAKMVLGVKQCYLSQAPGYLKPLVLLMGAGGDMETGLELLRQARDHGLFTRVDAGYYLAAVQIELLNDSKSSRVAFEAVADAFPNNPFFNVFAAELERNDHDAGASCERLERVKRDGRLADFQWMRVRAQQGLLWSALGAGKPALALATADEALRLAETEPEIAKQRWWMVHGRAEALNGLGRTDEAIAVWESIPASEKRAREMADRRLVAVRSVAPEPDLGK